MRRTVLQGRRTRLPERQQFVIHAPIVKRKTIFSLYSANSLHSRSTHSRCGLETISTPFPAARSFRSTVTHSSRNRGVMSWLVGNMIRPLSFFLPC